MPAPHDAQPNGPWTGDRLCDGAVALFAVWTLLAHATVVQGGTLRQLLAASGIAIAMALVARARLPKAAFQTKIAEAPEVEPPPLLRAVVALGAIAVVAAFATTGSLAVLWTGGAALVASALAWEIAGRSSAEGGDAAAHPLPPGASDGASGREVGAIALLGLVCAITTTIAIRPDADDAFYVNVAVSAADHPDAPLLAGDTLHGVAGVPLPLPVYRIHSLELLEGAVALATPLRALDVAHLFVPVLAALLVPLGFWRLFRRVLPRYRLLATALAIGFLASVAETSHGPANFGLLRLHQGKSILLTVLAPLLVAYGIEYAAAPDARRWLRLAAAQVAAVGLSASALWLAPLLALIGLASPLRITVAGARRLATGALTSSYVLILALWLRGETVQAFAQASRPLESSAHGSHQLAAEALYGVLGGSSVLFVTLALVLGGWSLARGTPLRRGVALSSAAFLLLWSPFWAGVVAEQLTSPATYYRVSWVLPIPLLWALGISGPVRFAGPGRARSVGLAATAALAVALLALSPARHTLSPENLVTLDGPRWRIPEAEGRAARAIARHAPPDSRVLAPEAVSIWIPTLHQHPFPLVVREGYLPLLEPYLGGAELNRRLRLGNAVAGVRKPPHAERMLADAIADYPLAAVCLSARAAAWPELRAALEASPLERVAADADYEVWARPSKPGPESPP